MNEIKTLNGHPLKDTEARKAATARRYGMTEIPVFMPKSASSGFPFPSAEILDVWDYGLVVQYGTKNIYKLNPATLAMEFLFEAENGSTTKSPNWYCGRILSRYTNAYDYLLMWDANTQKMFRFATTGVGTKTFPDQKLGWLRSTGLDREINHSGETSNGTIIYAEYYLETYGVETDVVKVWRSTRTKAKRGRACLSRTVATAKTRRCIIFTLSGKTRTTMDTGIWAAATDRRSAIYGVPLTMA